MGREERLAYETIMLALQLGSVATARVLFDEASEKNHRQSGLWQRLAGILRSAEVVEANHGRGALLDTGHPFIAYCIKINRFEPEMVEAAKLFQANALAISPLEELVPGLTRHQGRRLRR